MNQSADNATAASFAELSTAILSDATGGRGVVAPGLQRLAGSGVIAGRAVTAHCAEGSLQAVFAALDHAQAGDMLCVVGSGNTAYLGDQLANNLLRLGLAGAVIEGFARDRATIAPMPLNIHARGLFPTNLRRRDPGRAMEAIIIGGISIEPGDWIVADDDGIIVIPPADVESAIANARMNALIEQRIRVLVSSGAKVSEAVQQAVAEIRASQATSIA